MRLSTDGRSEELLKSLMWRTWGTDDVFVFMRLPLVPCIFIESCWGWVLFDMFAYLHCLTWCIWGGLWCDTSAVTRRGGSKSVLHTGTSNHAILPTNFLTEPFWVFWFCFLISNIDSFFFVCWLTLICSFTLGIETKWFLSAGEILANSVWQFTIYSLINLFTFCFNFETIL